MKVQQGIEKYVEIERITGDEPKFDAFFNDIVVRNAEDARLVANELRKKWNLGDGQLRGKPGMRWAVDGRCHLRRLSVLLQKRIPGESIPQRIRRPQNRYHGL